MTDTIASRVTRVVSGSVHALLDAVESAAPEATMAQAIREVEDALVQSCFRLLMALLRLGVTPTAECYTPDVIEKHLPRIIELVQLITANRETLKETQS